MRVVGSFELNVITSVTTQVSSLANMINTMQKSSEVKELKATRLSCVYCGEDHIFKECPSNPAFVYYMGNLNMNNNPYSNTYNLDRVDKGVAETTNLESNQSKTLEQYKKSNTNVKIGPSNAKANSNSIGEHNSWWARKSLQPEIHASLPFPQRFQNHRYDQQFRQFLDFLKQLHINIPLVEALEQNPNYVRFMKDILPRKRQLREFKIVAMNEWCTAMLTNKLPPKFNDLESFTIPYSIGNKFFVKALCDLVASINLLPMSVFKNLGIGEVRRTTMTLQLVDQTYVHPEGKIEDVLERVDKFIFLANFIVLDCEADKDVPIILGRLFLTIG
ncbi:uncharacterized protein LOC128040444 [Gossypium raimondii]|uniref:uncharacterized protein LOC128040444 n=1 Tax=Gossypium raimondii TaxID=29730 RepID=UPI00227BD116|nr:uncharacterized protein LOC128040444 [Gossypium raimondii]